MRFPALKGHVFVPAINHTLLLLFAVVATFGLTVASSASAHVADTDDPVVTTSDTDESDAYITDEVAKDDGEITLSNYVTPDGVGVSTYMYVRGTSGSDSIAVDVDNGGSNTMKVAVSINGEGPNVNFSHGSGTPGLHTHLNVSDPEHYGCEKKSTKTTCTLRETSRGSGYLPEYELQSMILIDDGSETDSDGSSDDVIGVTGDSDAVTELSYLYVLPDVNSDYSDKETVAVGFGGVTVDDEDKILQTYTDPGSGKDDVYLVGPASSWRVGLKDGNSDRLFTSTDTDPSVAKDMLDSVNGESSLAWRDSFPSILSESVILDRDAFAFSPHP